MNHVCITGRLTKEPEFRSAASGTSVVNFTVACGRSNGQEGSDFIQCVAFSKTAEFIKKYFTKGQKIDLVGHITTGQFTNKDGQKVYTWNVTADKVEFGESKASKNQNVEKSAPSNAPTDAPTETVEDFLNVPDGIDDEVPF